jgi:thioredoxin-like negative regulator of GroEL
MIESLLQAERLLVVGQVDGAEKIYESTLAADPRNSIALVGLARVALERGDDRLAYRHTCDALDIDRQNAAALRLEARLSEVLAARGEPVERPAWLAQPATGPKAASQAKPTGAPKPAKRRGLLGRILRG